MIMQERSSVGYKHHAQTVLTLAPHWSKVRQPISPFRFDETRPFLLHMLHRSLGVRKLDFKQSYKVVVAMYVPEHPLAFAVQYAFRALAIMSYMAAHAAPESSFIC